MAAKKKAGRRSKSAAASKPVGQLERQTPEFSAPKPVDATLSWDMVLSGAEARAERAKNWVLAKAPPPDLAALASSGSIPARFAISWIDPTYPIFFYVLVNGINIGPPYDDDDGHVIRDIMLLPGENRIDWGIRHIGQGWQNAIYLKIGERVFLLSEDKDPTTSESDDYSSKTVTFTL